MTKPVKKNPEEPFSRARLRAYAACMYEVIRSRRKTLSLQLRPDGTVLVRSPLRTSSREIDAFVRRHEAWIRIHRQKLEERREINASVPSLTQEQMQELAREAARVIPLRAAWYAPQIGVTYGRITIRFQRTRWGSCSSKGNLNFNSLLMLAPPEVLDSVVVHELCHRKEMNHSDRFYREVLRVFPEYHRWHGWLKENGSALLSRLPKT